MKKLALLLLLPFIFVACDTLSEKTIYNKNDPEWSDAAQLQADECIRKSSVLKNIETYSEFDNSPFTVGDIFRISQDLDDTKEIFVRVNAINATDMILEYNSSDNTLDKVVLFSETEYQNLESDFKLILCSPNFKENFTASSSSGSFTWDKYTVIEADDGDEGDVDEAFTDIRDSLNIDTSYPLFFYYYNGKKVKKEILTDGGAEVNSTSTITVSKANDHATCKDGVTQPCVFTNTLVKTCTLTIDTNAKTNTEAVSDFIKNAGDCTFLVSNSK